MVHMRRALGGVAVCALGVAVGLYSFAVARRSPDDAFLGASAAGRAALLVAGWALVGSGVALWLRRPASRSGVLLAAAGVAWFLVEWTNSELGSALAFTVGLCLYGACPPLVGHAALSFPDGRLRGGLDRTAVGLAYVGFVLVLGVAPTLFWSPPAQGCNDCPRNLALVSDRGDLWTHLTRVGLYVGLASSLVLAALVLRKLLRATVAARRASWPLLAASVAYLGLVAATLAASLRRGQLWNGSLERALWLGEALALVGVAAGATWSWVRTRRDRASVARLVVDLSRSPAPGGLRDALAEIAGDPGLVLAYPLADDGRLVDVDGRPVVVPDGVAETRLVRDGRTVAVLAHTPGLLDDQQLVDEVTAAARLALENERLQAEVRARLAELRASRARIVAAADTERKRLERDLHDGAQQRLVALALSLRLLRSRVGADPGLDEAEDELERGIAELRDLAHGIFPAVLGDAGLAVAVRALAEEGDVPIRVGPLPERRFAPAVETAAYTVVAEAARTATGVIAVCGSQRDGTLVVEVETGGELQPNATVALEDRLGALDGHLALLHDDGRVTIRAEIPCES
jgi:signal transduction histidine kinase